MCVYPNQSYTGSGGGSHQLLSPSIVPVRPGSLSDSGMANSFRSPVNGAMPSSKSVSTLSDLADISPAPQSSTSFLLGFRRCCYCGTYGTYDIFVYIFLRYAVTDRSVQSVSVFNYFATSAAAGHPSFIFHDSPHQRYCRQCSCQTGYTPEGLVWDVKRVGLLYCIIKCRRTSSLQVLWVSRPQCVLNPCLDYLPSIVLQLHPVL